MFSKFEACIEAVFEIRGRSPGSFPNSRQGPRHFCKIPKSASNFAKLSSGVSCKSFLPASKSARVFTNASFYDIEVVLAMQPAPLINCDLLYAVVCLNVRGSILLVRRGS